MQQEPTAMPPTPAPTPASPKRRGAYITGAVLVVLVVGGLAIGLTPNHLGLPLPGTHSSAAASSTSDPTKTGCPSATANVAWPHPATTTLHFANAGSVTNLHSGDTVQIDLPATNYRWNVAPITSSSVTVLSPAGYYDATNNTCAWRFSAQSSGTALIQFIRRCNVALNKICSDIQVQVPFTIMVA